MKRSIGGSWPSSKGLYGHEGIRGPLDKKKPGDSQKKPPPPLGKSRRFNDPSHAVRFLLIWLSTPQPLSLEPALCLELVMKLYPLRQKKELFPIIKRSLTTLSALEHKRLLANTLKCRWLDLIVPAIESLMRAKAGAPSSLPSKNKSTPEKLP
jgi:hypothetical protein